MAIEMECPNPGCKQLLTAPDEMAGKQVRCPACKTIFRLRSGGSTATFDLADDTPPPVSAPPPVPPVTGPPMRPMPPYAPYGPMYSPYYRPSSEGKSVASLVLGIISIVPCWIYPFVGLLSIICGILAVVFGKSQLNAVRMGRIGPNNEGTARGGLVCGTIGLVLSSLVGLFWLFFFSAVIHHL